MGKLIKELMEIKNPKDRGYEALEKVLNAKQEIRVDIEILGSRYAFGEIDDKELFNGFNEIIERVI